MSDPATPPPNPQAPSNGGEPLPPGLIRPEIFLPGAGRSISEFADEVGEALEKLLQDKIVNHAKGKPNRLETRSKNTDAPDPSNKEECFLCIRLGIFGRIRKQVNSGRQASGLYFEPIDNEQAVTELERWIDFIKRDKYGEHSESMSPSLAKTLIASDMFRRRLPVVDRIFDFAIPVGYRGGGVAPEKQGMDFPGTLEVDEEEKKDGENVPAQESKPKPKSANAPDRKFELVSMRPGFGTYRQRNGEQIFYYCDAKLKHYISVEEAKEVINLLFSEFNFVGGVTGQSRCHAIARLLTPYCQALMGWRKRSPLWVFAANKPRAGKDYLAMLTPLVHAYYPIQDPPLEDDEEIKRRITAALMSGRRFMHFANCRRDLDNPSLEAALTTEFWTDRIIRSSSEATVPNEMIFSLSYNHDWEITPDLIARLRMIRLENQKADSNARRFKMKYLHDLVTMFDPGKDAPGKTANTKLCRRNILAALNALTRHWLENFKKGTSGVRLASYPEWSEVVGGIMRAAELGNPCKPDRQLTAKTYDDQARDLIALARLVAKDAPAAKLQTAEITTQFILPHKEDFPDFSARLFRYGGDEKKFNKEFGQILSENTDHPFMGEDAEYLIEKVKSLTPNHFVFVRKEYKDVEEDDGTAADIADTYLI